MDISSWDNQTAERETEMKVRENKSLRLAQLEHKVESQKMSTKSWWIKIRKDCVQTTEDRDITHSSSGVNVSLTLLVK